MTLHPDSEKVLALVAGWEAPAELTVEGARASEVRRHNELDAPGESVEHVWRIGVPVGDRTIPITIYVPHGGRPDGLLVQFHGGGWTIGSPELWQPQARTLANAGNCAVASVGFRLAPEHPHPAGFDDAYTATTWLAEHGGDLGLPTSTVIVGGDSSGGNLAAAVCLACRDRGGPRLAGQLLMYPALARDVDTESRRAFADGYLVSLDALMWFWGHYVGPDVDASHPYVSPLLADDLSGLPPTIIATAECDVVRDEGEAYARRLAEAGVPVAARRFDGVLHGFLGQSLLVRAAADAFAWIGRELRAVCRASATQVVGDAG